MRELGVARPDGEMLVPGAFGIHEPLDHWPRVTNALLAGGGLRHGQVIGSTDRLGGEPSERPVPFGDVFATLYQNLGIDVAKVTIPDLTGRPQFLVPDGCQPMKELVG
jgi:hypothetical protein